MDEENREETIADALRPVLEEGEAYSVFCHEGEVHVKEADTSVCAVIHPRLYGRLLSLSTQLDEAGAGYSRLPTLLGLTFCVGLHLHWWDDWLGPILPVERLDHWLFFVLVFYVIFQGLGILNGALQRGIYRRGREELFALMSEAKLDRDSLLSMIEGDAAVSRAGHHLKLDNEAPRISPQLADRG
jgi:hypothetical protein